MNGPGRNIVIDKLQQQKLLPITILNLIIGLDVRTVAVQMPGHCLSIRFLMRYQKDSKRNDKKSDLFHKWWFNKWYYLAVNKVNTLPPRFCRCFFY
jgi:hypothetical protein